MTIARKPKFATHDRGVSFAVRLAAGIARNGRYDLYAHSAFGGRGSVSSCSYSASCVVGTSAFAVLCEIVSGIVGL